MNKASLKRLALELRAEMGLGPHDRFDPYQLAAAYGVDIITLSTLDCSDEARRHFQVTHSERFSGALIPFAGGRVVILENDSHSPLRRRSTVSHEMAHVVREHQFSARLVDDRGCRVSDRDQEDEAAELAGELLLPFEAARFLAIRGASDEDAAAHFDVSVHIASWRLNSTGARRIAQRRAARKQTNAFRQHPTVPSR